MASPNVEPARKVMPKNRENASNVLKTVKIARLLSTSTISSTLSVPDASLDSSKLMANVSSAMLRTVIPVECSSRKTIFTVLSASDVQKGSSSSRDSVSLVILITVISAESETTILMERWKLPARDAPLGSLNSKASVTNVISTTVKDVG